ncbi:unnamed protein product [Paramecium primaurelia]|uniref:USP domain-containing protein n=1 Tax=Paramecium primaurelia TaxID=5886 RepID=A0A8S1MAA9_PARPR|nr:unnamed protein product [Paramecium primaurelia]
MDVKKTKKKPELSEQLFVGNYVDVYHQGSKQFKLAYILQKTDKEIEVTYDGLSKKENEIIKLSQNRVQFARRSTQNYTGDDYRQQKTSRDYLKYSREDCEKYTKELITIMQTNFQGMTPIEIIQSVRVRQFIYLDMVLSSELQAKEIPIALEYIKTYYNFIKWYFDQFPKYFADYMKYQINNELYIIDERVSIASCLQEVCEAFCMLFGSIWRLLKQENSFFYLNFDILQQQIDKIFTTPVYQGFVSNPNIDDWKLYQGANDVAKCIKKTWQFYLRTMSYFRSIGGLQSWDNLLKPYEGGGEYTYIPLKAMSKIVLTQQYLSQYFPQQEQGNMARKTLEWFQFRVVNLTIQDIKDTDIDQIRENTQEMQYYFLKGYSQDQLNKLVDEIQLQMSLKFLKSTFLEKRVKGLCEIKDFTEKFKFETSSQIKMKTSISKDDLIKWITQNKILDYTVLGDSVHPELIKRSSDVAIFLCRNQAFQHDYVDKIWLNNYDKHETTQLALYEFFKAISPVLQFQGIEKLYIHISNIPYTKYNENIVSMIRTFTEAALSQKFHEQQLQLKPDKRFMTFNQLWELLQDRDDSLVGSHIQEQCFQAARMIISQIPQTKQFISQYFGKCFELIGSHKSVYQAISFVHYFLDKQFKDDKGKKELIQSTDEKYNIIELFVKDIEVYMEKVRQYFKNDITQDIIINGVQKFSQNVFFRLQMLNYLLQQTELKINYEQSVRLWDALAAKTKGSIQKRELNKILISNYYPDITSFRINQIYFDKDGESKFFTQILCNPERNDYENYTIEDFELFQVFFKSFNQTRQMLKYYGNSMRFIVNDHSFEGKNAIWQIFAKVKDLSLLEQIANFILNLYTQLNQQLDTKCDKIYQEMMDKCLELIQQQCPGLTTRSINLLLSLFNYFQSGPPSKKSLKSTNYTSFKVHIINTNNQITNKEYKEGDTTTVNQWKQKLSEELQIAYSQLDITVENRPIEQQYDIIETYVNQVFHQMATIKVKINNKNHPKNYLSQEQRTFDILFKLLDKQESMEFLSQVWDLINRLPTNIQIKKQVENCKDWKKYLDHSFFDMFYVLQIIQALLENGQWCEQFNNSDGVDLVTQKFLGQQLQFQQRPLEIKSCLTYIDILSHQNIKIREPQIIQQIKQKIIEILQELSHYIKTKKKLEQGQKKTQQQKEMNEIESRLLRRSFHYLDESGCKQYIRQNNELKLQLYNYFVEHENQELKKEYSIQLLNLKNTQESKLLIKIMLDEVLKDVILNNKQKCEHLFEFCCNLLLQENDLNIEKFDFEHLLSYIKQILQQLPYNENTVKDQDQILIGLLKLLNVIIDKLPNLSNNNQLFEQILSYLFENEGETKCKCKSQQSRTAGFNCLFTLLKNQQNMNKFLNIVSPLHSTNTWRTKNLNDWNIQSKFHEKSSTGYVGLYNLACICYMNSLLQQLYMVPAFREKLLKVEDKNTCIQEENLLHQLKCLFLALKYSQKQYHNPKKFCHAFKDLDGNPTNIFEQMDVDEFCNLLMDRIELNIKSTSDEDLVKRFFGGVMSNEIIGKTCPHYSEREEPFFAISLPVANKKNLEECLQTLVHGDLLEGDNAYSCEQCNKKVSALKRMCIKKLPDHLILVLKRFNFDFDLMAKAKINDRIEFPFELDMFPYSQQGLRQQENRTNNLSVQDNPQEYYQYRLTGVVIHMGSADSGHYYSFIQDKDDLSKWYEFNDIIVTPADIKDLKNDAFGGADKFIKNKYPSQLKDKSKSAYMLFYERINPINIPDQSEKIDVEMDQKTMQFLDEIKDENRKFQIQRFIFSPEYFNFMQNLIKFQLQQQQVQDQIIKTLVFFYLTCAVRENDKTFVSNNILDIQELLRKSPKTSQWLLKCFNQPQYIKEYQFDCSKKMVRKFVISMIITAIDTIQKQEGYKDLFEMVDDKPKSLVASLINAWILMIPELKRSLKNSVEFYDLFYKFAKLHQSNAQYLIQKKLVGKLLDLSIEVISVNPNKNLIPPREIVRRMDDIKVIKFNDDPSNYLGQQNYQNVDVASNYYDELLEKKFEKSMNSGPSTSRVYLWRVIAYLIKGEYKQLLSPEEQMLLQFDAQFISILLEEGDCKLAIRMISDILCALSMDNQKQSDIIITSIIKQINDKEYKEYRKYLVVLKRLFQMKDQLTITRINSGMTKLLDTMQKQGQYFLETDVCQQYILRMVFKNQAVYQWMVKNQKVWQWIIEINNTQPHPNDKLIANNSIPQKCQHRLHNIYLPNTSQGYAKLLSWKKLQYINLPKEPFKQNDDFDTDDDLTEKNIKVDDKIDFYDQNQWITATVSKVMGDYIHLTFSGKMAPQNMDIELDNERLAPFNTLSNNNKIPGYNNQSYEMVIEHPSDHDNDTEEGNNNSNNQTDSDEE